MLQIILNIFFSTYIKGVAKKSSKERGGPKKSILLLIFHQVRYLVEKEDDGDPLENSVVDDRVKDRPEVKS